VVSGSNANLLGGELATHLTGRYLATEVLPFSFREFSSCHGLLDSSAWEKSPNLDLLNRFLRLGGYPQIVTLDNNPSTPGNDPATYLSTIIENVINKDIVKRYGLRKQTELQAVAEWVFSNVANELTLKRLTAAGSGMGLPKSTATTEKFLNYLQDAYLIKLLTRHDNNFRERNKSPKKVYALDNGVAVTMGVRHSPDNGSLLENVVCTELLKAGKQLRYFRSPQGHEVDFLITEGHEVTELCEVSWSVDEQKALDKKLSSLAHAAKETRCSRATIVTWLEEKTVKAGDLTINIVPFYKWAYSL
jgi:predicted AAA+ superfamily ATPase